MGRPRIETERLILRPFTLDDAPEVQRLAGDMAIAATTTNIPHPYKDGMAEDWIKTHEERFEKGELANFAIVLKKKNNLIGAIGLQIKKVHENGELGYWIGKPYWGRGYCTEAAQAVLKYGFRVLKLNRIYATYMSDNPSSGRVMEKIGMRYEGTLRQHVKKWGEYKDLKMYSILKGEYKTSLDSG